MKFYPKCKEEHSDFSNFCHDCGGELKNRREPRCPKCKNGIFGRFCHRCGIKFNEKLLKRAKITA